MKSDNEKNVSKYANDYPGLGSRIKAARNSAGLTQAALSKKIGVTIQYVSGIENGVRSPSLEVLAKIALVTGTSVDALLYEAADQKDCDPAVREMFDGQPVEVRKFYAEEVRDLDRGWRELSASEKKAKKRLQKENPIDYEALGKRIAAARKAAGLTQTELAKKVDIVVQYVSGIENGKKTVSLQKLIEMAEVLGTSIDELLYDTIPTERAGYDREAQEIFANATEEEKKVLLKVLGALRVKKR